MAYERSCVNYAYWVSTTVNPTNIYVYNQTRRRSSLSSNELIVVQADRATIWHNNPELGPPSATIHSVPISIHLLLLFFCSIAPKLCILCRKVGSCPSSNMCALF